MLEERFPDDVLSICRPIYTPTHDSRGDHLGTKERKELLHPSRLPGLKRVGEVMWVPTF